MQLPVEQIQSETPLLLSILSEIKTKTKDLKDRLQPLISKIKAQELATDQGISLLEVKCHSLLSYMTHLSYFILLKLQGMSVEGHPCTTSLVELRTVLEKIKPLENKLKYQIDKLVKSAVLKQDTDVVNADKNAAAEEMDALAFKPNPELLGGLDDEQGSFFVFFSFYHKFLIFLI